ncbi:MAG: response regulator receiver protein [Crocinitomicaceae bacterium]|nr:response regulator receiver protein [Crocinitomicaceae bacterium]|tara:strand:+ start:3056 stop:4567 length:1512 start_codon:yes stop_codon:yes gene_type:complete
MTQRKSSPVNERYIGLFYEKNNDLLQQTSGVLQQFSHALYFSDETPSHQLQTNFNQSLSTQVNTLTTADILLRENVVRAKPVVEAIQQQLNALPQNSNTVVFCEMTWAVRTPSGDIYLRELHEELQHFLEQTNITFICIYNETILLDEQLLLGLFAHPQLLTSDGVKQNPYYLPTQVIKKNQAKTRFNYWLANIDEQRKASLPDFSVQLEDDHKVFPVYKSIDFQVAQSDEGRWKIRCFGDLRIRRENGDIIDWNTKSGATKKLKTVFAFLLLRGDKGATNEELADLLWPDAEDTDQALNRLYHTIRYLRIVLENGDKNAGKNSSFIVNQSSTYYLKLPHDSWIDLPMFRELCFKGNAHLKEGNVKQAKICYESAERLYTGDMFQDIPMKYIENLEHDWCWSKRQWFKSMHHKLFCSLAQINRSEGNLSKAISYADKVLAEDAISVPAIKEKLLTLEKAERYDAIHRQYNIYIKAINKFNIGAPSPEIRALYRIISEKIRSYA